MVQIVTNLLELSLYSIDLKCLSSYLFTPSCDPGLPCYQSLSVLTLSHVCSSIDNSLYCLATLLNQQVSLQVLIVYLIEIQEHTTEGEDLMAALCHLFLRQSFQSLQFQLANIPISFCFQLFHCFMTSRCLEYQDFQVNFQERSYFLRSNALCKGGSGCTPDCGLEHKVLKCSYYSSELLKRLSTVHLRELQLCFSFDSQNNLHDVATYPDLHVVRLMLDWHDPLFEPTVRDDFKSIFQMSTLREISLDGYWTRSKEIKQALVHGLQQQVEVGSLRMINLSTSYQECYYEQFEFEELWNSIFSLQHLSELEVALGYDLSKLVCVGQLDHVFLHSWMKFASEKKLKLLRVNLGSGDFSNITNAVKNIVVRPV